MALRLFNGRSNSENGWWYVDEGSCTWLTVPGCDPPVQLQIQNGQPLAIMGAFAADFNAYVERLRNGDSACWTPGNSVRTSNHPGGTAMDLDWELHRFQISYDGFNQAQIATIRELLAFYEKTIFWGQDWGLQGNGPFDCMHFQMGYDTWGSENVDRVQDFIKRKIRADGFSTFRRSGPVVPPAPPPLSRADRYALACINEGKRLGITPRGIKIALSVELVETTGPNPGNFDLKMYANSNDPPSLNLPHDAVGHDHMSVGLFQQQPPWGSLADRMDPTRSATIFFTVDKGPGVRGLTKIPYDYHDTSRTPGFYAQKVQGSAFPDRYDQRYADAEQLFDRLASTQPTQPPISGEDMAQVPQEQWDNFYRAYMSDVPSLSPLRHLGEGPIGPVHRLLRNIDGSEHIEIVKTLAMLRHPPSIALLQEVAGADPVQYPDRQGDAKIAQAILAEIFKQPVDVAVPEEAVSRHAQLPAPVQEPVLVPVVAVQVPDDPPTAGQVIGELYDVLDKLRLADALPIEGRAPLAALISVLQTKNGSTL